MKFIILFITVIGAVSALLSTDNCHLNRAKQDCLKWDNLNDLKNKFSSTAVICKKVDNAEKCIAEFIKDCAENEGEKKSLKLILGGILKFTKKVCESPESIKKTEDSRVCLRAVSDQINTRCPYRGYVIAVSSSEDKNFIKKTVCW